MDSTDDHSAATRLVLERYLRELYDARDLTMVEQLMADPMHRHDAGGAVTTLTHDDCRARIGGFFETYRLLTFRIVHLIVEGPLASLTYELTMTANDGTESQISSIEIFAVASGKITDVWNAHYTDGPWV